MLRNALRDILGNAFALFSKINLYLLAFFASFNISKYVYTHSFWNENFINTYSSIFINHYDVFGIIGFLFLIFSTKKIKYGHAKGKIFLFALSIILLTNIFFAKFDLIFFTLMFFKIFALICIYLLIINNEQKIQKIFMFFSAGLSVNAIFGIMQFINGHDLGAHVIGEPHVVTSMINVAKIQIANLLFLRSYGLFEHPNIFGGFLAFSILCIIYFKITQKDQVFLSKSSHYLTVFLIIQVVALVLSFSRSAMVALFFGFCALLYGMKKINKQNIFAFFLLCMALFLIFFFRGDLNFSAVSVLDRINGAKIALMQFSDNPFGLGFRQSTLFLEDTVGKDLNFWEFQPVHNFWLLLLVEFGILSLVLCIKILYKHFKSLCSMPLFVYFIFIGFFDHYLLSSDQGNLLLIILLSIFSTFISKNTRSDGRAS